MSSPATASFKATATWYFSVSLMLLTHRSLFSIQAEGTFGGETRIASSMAGRWPRAQNSSKTSSCKRGKLCLNECSSGRHDSVKSRSQVCQEVLFEAVHTFVFLEAHGT